MKMQTPKPKFTSARKSAASSLLLLADDLTGACDSGIAFAQRGLRTYVQIDRLAPAPHAQVIVRSSDSRDLDPTEARRRLVQVTRESAPGAGIFKKIDSVFRGNTLLEMLFAVECIPHELAVIAPAAPMLGRRSVDGTVVIEEITGERTLPIVQELTELGLDLRHLPLPDDSSKISAAIERALAAGITTVYCDATTQPQLETLVEAVESLQQRTLWIGSAGLAHALASHRSGAAAPAPAPASRGAVVIFTGSEHALNLTQINHLSAAYGVEPASVCDAVTALDLTVPVILRVPRSLATAGDIRRSIASIASVAPDAIGCLVLTGGDTAALVCRALGIEAISLAHEFAPGVPMGVALGGPFAGTRLILKSGGFGDTGVLTRIAAAHISQEHPEGDGAGNNISGKPTIVVTLGDPAGVGCEVTLRALAQRDLRDTARWVLLGDAAAISAAEQSTGIQLRNLTGVDFRDQKMLPAGEPVVFGRLSADYGRAAAAYVHRGTTMCLSGEADALVTAPLNKEAVALSGMHFSGHTEYIAEICGVNDSRMLLAGVKLSVVHVSTHTSLRNACNLDRARIIRTIELGNEAMKLLGHAAPRIAVCGLNPHAGEHGLFGTEDEEIIRPAVEECRARGIDCEGPVPADTIFFRAVAGSHDLIVAMYHDQGHIPMKLLDFEATVNTSLGIPIIRTSVDHGTAFDIAGKNIASEGNMVAAMRMAVTMAHHRLAGSVA